MSKRFTSSALYATLSVLLQRVLGATVARRILSAGPYLLIELVLPGGTLVALVLYVCRNRRAALVRVRASA